MFRCKTMKIERPLSVDDLVTAELVCIQLSMKLTLQDYQKGVLNSLRPKIDDDGVIVIQSRAVEGLKLHYGPQRFPILTYKDPL